MYDIKLFKLIRFTFLYDHNCRCYIKCIEDFKCIATQHIFLLQGTKKIE